MPSRSKANRPGRGTPRRAKPKRPSSGPPAPAAKLQRWIDLLAALLRRHYPATFEELVRDVPGYRRGQTKETRRRMFERDKDELRAFGIPIETIAIEGEIAAYQLSRRDFYLPYLQLLAEGRPSRPNTVSRFGYRALPTLAFEPDELGAIVEAGNRVRHLGDPALAADAESALRKLAVDLAVDLGAAEATVVPPRERPDPAVLAEIDEALARRKRLTFTYRSMAQGVTSTRTVEPFGLFFVGQHWYLAGRTPGEEVVKNYRVSRMRDAQVNRVKPGTPDYVVPGDFSLAAHARARQAWELGDGEALEAVVEFRGEDGATRAAARLGEPADDSSGEGAAEGAARRRRFRVRRPDAFVRWLLSFAGGAVPVSPPELVASYRALVAGTLALYTGAAAGVDGVAPRAGGGEPRAPRRDRPDLVRHPAGRRSMIAAAAAAAQLRRILNLIPTLADDRPHLIEEVARRAGVDRSTLLADLRSLVDRFDDPPGFVEGLQIYIEPDRVQVRSDHFLRPMRLTRSELAALELGLTMLRGERPADEHPTVERARDRLRRLMVKLPEDPIGMVTRHVAPLAGDPEHLRALRRAIRDRRKARLRYRRSGSDRASDRVVCPYALLFASGAWYLVAHCERSDGLRVFRLDRMEGVDPTPERFERPQALPVEQMLRSGKVFQPGETITVRIRYSARIARWIGEREGVSPERDGPLTLDHSVADVDWVVRHVLQYGPDAEVLAPAEVRGEVRRRLEGVLAAGS